MRGRDQSDGDEFGDYDTDVQDGYDAVEWAAKLPGANGKVGMIGHKDGFDRFLCGQIGLGHKVGRSFFPHLKSTDPVQQNLSTSPCGPFTNFDIFIHRDVYPIVNRPPVSIVRRQQQAEIETGSIIE